MDNAAISHHYNERRDEGRKGRQTSPILQLRNLNNWVKSVLINLHTRPGARVLDLCSGKGGDLQKWARAPASSYVACDTAEVSVRQALGRYNELGRRPFPAVFLVGDCFAVDVLAHLEDGHGTFDVVSCQFAVHYAFENEERVRRMLSNVAGALKPGGFFIGTTPDSSVLVRKLRAIPGMSFANAVFKVVFDDTDPPHKNKAFSRDKSPYGIRYTFTLDTSVEDCPEYLVHFPSFEKLAVEYGLELLLLQNFHHFFKEYSASGSPYSDLLVRMRVLDETGTMSADQWDAAYLYTVFAFRKKGGDGTDGGLAAAAAEAAAMGGYPAANEDDIIFMS
ncbi:hypothetical protein BU14_0289s0023 [Porphyra umbilicalis]|uniref:mRNA (guanine-N(7))-methyltransferase n=1 Tax=Porphyra umbilicalis TaxID=2786 RepID=A0A1X6P0Q7_PORUM|nr:hypothetical protein BU14_0289s0023 [Porphyra umbilicalis]|eukprot:OSX74444.1 hypothetical protein BU14_0289s0023 [Porphyra umbilicalis]